MRVFRLQPICAAALLWVSGAAQANQVEQTIGGIDAMIAACGPIDAKYAKAGAEMLERLRTQHKLDLTAVRKSDAYLAIYNPELNRLLALAPKARQQACQSVF